MSADSLIKELQKDQDFRKLEKYEKELKALLLEILGRSQINDFVQATREVGLLLKYKSYGVKCCTLLGYSIFLLHANEGFSFQRHLNFKTELFHVIDVLPGGYIFIADFDELQDDWSDSLEKWWRDRNRSFDCFRQYPNPGDVYKIQRTGIVHTAIGCILEEYANTSTDMVDRLFDQNRGRAVGFGKRKKVLQQIANLSIPIPRRQFVLKDGEVISENQTVVQHNQGAVEYLMLADDNFTASRLRLNTAIPVATGNSFVSLFCSMGGVDLTSSYHSIKSLRLARADSVILPPETVWTVNARGVSEISVLKIDRDKAFL